MLNEQRVKHMVKLAFYETKYGNEELKASSFYKKDYITFHMLWSAIWITLAYLILMVLLAMTFMSALVEDGNIGKIVLVAIAVIGIYAALLITYIRVSKKIYQKKHARAYYHVKKFKSDLSELEVMYEKEDLDEETI